MSPHRNTDGRKIVVVHSLMPPDGRTKFVDQIVDGAPDTIDIRFFSWRTILLGRYDIFHVHWPELTLRGKSPVRRFIRRRALDAAVIKMHLTGAKLVRTMHNTAPHELGDRREDRALAKFDRNTDLFIRLNPTTDIETDVPVVTILHGHYRDRFSSIPKPPPVQGRLLYFGIIRPYKAVDQLAAAFAGVTVPGLTLRIVGSPSVGQREIMEAAAGADDRVSLDLRFVDDAELVTEISQAELIALPYLELHNSGSVLAALSLDRPVLVPRRASTEALADEVGRGWVYLYDGAITAELIEKTMAELHDTPRSDPPQLGGREWSVLGEQHFDAYARVLKCEPTRKARHE